ncbi:Variable surface protein Vir7-like [Plasmodium coatneyi]|uniref:Variable surface protein Vir7-like n=1 Tax=Plasmodium coatneyi TaxID=208452 RepID=A0A1B1DW53_9APIC|nr:Variable surface protein Vir7-like [Plasmodium coatneyi]ANQ07031.1 Variable surface protein Vir7-like [Plasmodium coatneyi]
MPDDGRTLTVSDLNDLPSREKYSTFDKFQGTYKSSYNFKNGTEEKLIGNGYTENEANKIMDAWSYTYLYAIGDSYNNEWCYWFYYWLGDILWGKTEDPELFSHRMNKTYNALKNPSSLINCELIHNTIIAKEFFYQMKKTYEFFKDRDKIRDQLSSHKYRCTPEYARYLQNTVAEYAAVRNHCRQKEEDAFCKKFQGEFGVGKYEEVAKFKCASVHRSGGTTPYADALQYKGKVTSPGSNSTITATAVSSAAVGLLGVPLVSALLYKVIIVIIYNYNYNHYSPYD